MAAPLLMSNSPQELSAQHVHILTSYFCTDRIKLFHRGKKRTRDENVEGSRKGEHKVIAAAFSLWNTSEVLLSLMV